VSDFNVLPCHYPNIQKKGQYLPYFHPQGFKFLNAGKSRISGRKIILNIMKEQNMNYG
jgi:hypothetical protein